MELPLMNLRELINMRLLVEGPVSARSGFAEKGPKGCSGTGGEAKPEVKGAHEAHSRIEKE